MAWLPDDELKDLLGRLPAFTGLTITSKAALRKQLEVVREQGYAVAVDELEVGLTAIAAPVRNAHGDVICSMSVSGPDLPAPAGAGRRGAAAAGRGRRRALAPPGLGHPLISGSRCSGAGSYRTVSI